MACSSLGYIGAENNPQWSTTITSNLLTGKMISRAWNNSRAGMCELTGLLIMANSLVSHMHACMTETKGAIILFAILYI